MNSEAPSIQQEHDDRQLADVIELRPDERSFIERHKKTIRNLALGTAALVATGVAAYEAVDYMAADWAEEVMDSVKSIE